MAVYCPGAPSGLGRDGRQWMEETVTDGISDVLAVKKSMLRTGTDTAMVVWF